MAVIDREAFDPTDIPPDDTVPRSIAGEAN
jgi:hypothetical protein